MKIDKKTAESVGKTLKLDWKKIPKDQFLKGLKVELEHGSRDKQTDVTGNNLVKTGRIALAHIKENIKYYDALETMEKKLSRKKNRGK